MYHTTYDDNLIKEFRKKYRAGILIHRAFYVTVILALIFINIVPDQWDTFSFFDAERNFSYFFGIKNTINDLMLLFIIATLIYGIPYLLKRIMKEKYVEFRVARQNRNFHSGAIREKTKCVLAIIIMAVYLFSTLYSLGSINSITVTDTGFYVQNRTFFRSEIEEYTFDFFEENSSIGIFDTLNNVRLGGHLHIGKYSPHLITLLEVFDERTGGQHRFVERIAEIMERH